MTSLNAYPSSSAYPTKDDDGNTLETEYGLSVYKDHQTFTIQVDHYFIIFSVAEAALGVPNNEQTFFIHPGPSLFPSTQLLLDTRSLTTGCWPRWKRGEKALNDQVRVISLFLF